jgi:hypothetical protein
MVTPGNPSATSTSTVTGTADNPTMAAESTFASIAIHLL